MPSLTMTKDRGAFLGPRSLHTVALKLQVLPVSDYCTRFSHDVLGPKSGYAHQAEGIWSVQQVRAFFLLELPGIHPHEPNQGLVNVQYREVDRCSSVLQPDTEFLRTSKFLHAFVQSTRLKCVN